MRPHYLTVVRERRAFDKGESFIQRTAVCERLNLLAGTEVSIDVQGDALVMKRFSQSYPDWRTMQGMVREGESMTKALESEHRDELTRDDARLQGR